MLKAQKLTLAVLVNAALISSAYANEQSEAKGFVEGASASVLLRNGFIQRDKKDGVHDTNSWLQSVMLNLESGFTQGPVGFAAGVVGDFSFKLGDNYHAGNSMIALKNDGQKDANGRVDPYDQWTRGGGYVKARASNTTLTYGTQILDLPVLASMTTRNVPEYFEGTLITSHEIKNLEVVAGKFTKNQLPEHIASDQNHLDRAYVWGAKYQFNDQLKAAYYGADLKDKLERHYANVNYKQTLANKDSLTYDFSGYHTKFEPGTTYSATGPANEDKKNNIWAVSATYNTGPHTGMLAYQQNTGNVGYDYGQNGDGGQSIYLPNSYLSDFIGNHEKSVQLQYTYDFADLAVPGLSWTTAYVYGWDIRVNNLTDDAKEREFFNQVSYKVQTGPAKDLNIRVRNSIYRASDEYQTNAYIGDTNEWRIFVDFPIKFF
ncbi:OprD family porin [Acinetobacter ursingii]|uniref:OprD family porin n=1 Tax=Acinetobacter ursingii TaxID=108980 RepID=UPI0021CD995A|nr:OprD family porin [Acinetobacter ursingii]MCU4482844.1 OprD family porin [Acinetobacter ursingii]MCU4507202.1 OprD family porin [Acinetobacter ursingii]MCU4571158.1 OprD family porin [Acinetobacter ursingii]